MTETNAYQETLFHLQRNHPKLVKFFKDTIAFLEKYILVDEKVIQAVGRLAIVSNYFFISKRVLLLTLNRNELPQFASLLYELVQVDYWYCKELYSAYPNFRFPLVSIATQVLGLIGNFPQNVGKGESLLRFCFQLPEVKQCAFVLKLFGDIATYAPGFLVEFHDILSEKLRGLAWETFVSWSLRGQDLLTSNRVEEGIALLSIKSKEGREMLGLSHGVLTDFENVLKIYASSLAGKDMEILSLELSNLGLKTPYTDGVAIFLPPMIDFFEESQNNENIYTALTAHQASALALGTYSFDLNLIDFEEELRDRYGMQLPEILENVQRDYGRSAERVRNLPTGEVEVTFANGRRLIVLETYHEEFFYRFPTPHFVHELFNLIENVRIEYQLSHKYTGLKEDFDVLNDYLWNARPLLPLDPNDRMVQLETLLECTIQHSLVGKWKTPDRALHLEDFLKDIVAEFDKVRNLESTVQDTADVCFRIYNILFDNFPLVTFCSQNDVHELFQNLGKSQIRPELVLDISPDLLAAREDPPQYDGPDELADSEIDLASFDNSGEKGEGLHLDSTTKSHKIFAYPEFNFLKGSYELKHCTLFENILDSVDRSYYEGIIRSEGQIYKRIKKRFLAIAPEDVEISRKWESGPEIHLGDAVDYAIDFLRGGDVDEKIYFQKLRNLRDVAVAILVDTSSSTDEVVNSQKIIDMEKAALSLLASALAVVGDTFAIYTFCSRGRRKVFFNILKDFYEPWNAHTQGRIAAVRAFAANRDGCAIRHTAARLSEMPHKTKLLILLSDGIPADHNYGAKSSAETSRYAIEDTRRAILECRHQGIIPYCLTIDKYAKDYIPHLYGDYGYTILDNVSLLPEKLSKLYLRLTR